MQYACKILNQKGTLNGLIFAWINFCVVTILGGILLILLIRKIKSTWNIEIHQFVKVDALVNLSKKMEIVFLFWNIAQKMSPIRKNKSTHNPQN